MILHMNPLMRKLKFAVAVLTRNFAPAKLPYKAILLVTWRCQARCLMCNIWKKERQNEFSLEEWRTFFRNNPYLKWLTLSGGEPFLRTDVEEILRSALEFCPGLYCVNMPTNALAPELVKKTVGSMLLLDIPRFVLSISLDGPEDVHDRLRGIPGAWQKAVSLLRWAKEKENENRGKFSVMLEHTLLPDSYGRFDEMVAQVRKEVPGVKIGDFMVTIGSVSSHYYGNAGGEDACCRIQDKQALEAALRQIIAARGREASWNFLYLFSQYFLNMAIRYERAGVPPLRCRAARSSVFVDPCGFVYPCNRYGRLLGSLRDSNYSIERLFSRNAMARIRRDIDQFKCGGCWTLCEASLSFIENLINPRALWRLLSGGNRAWRS